MQSGVDPRSLLSELGVDLEQIPQYVDEMTLWKLIINMLAEPPRRNKLRHVNTLDDVVRLLRGIFVNKRIKNFLSLNLMCFFRCTKYNSFNRCWGFSFLWHTRF